jgi:hypothetical protein
MPMAEPQSARPKPTPETQHFWDGTKAGELRLPAQVPNAKISVCHGVGGMFAASGTIIFTNER